MKPKNLTYLLVIFCLFLFLSFVGCGGLPYKIVALEGTAACNGEPISYVMISFTPVDGGKASVAYTDAQGKFVTLYNDDHDGVKAGELNVFFPVPIEGKETNAAGKKVIEKHGSAATGMKITVTKPDKNFKLDVTVP